jgi:hypothetical protein
LFDENMFFNSYITFDNFYRIFCEILVILITKGLIWLKKRKKTKVIKVSPLVINQLKFEIAQEMGIEGLEIYGGADLPSNIAGKLGGQIRKRVHQLVRAGYSPEELHEIARRNSY